MKYTLITINKLCSSQEIMEIANSIQTPFVFIQFQDINPGYLAFERFIQIAENSSAAMLYSDFYISDTGSSILKQNPLGEYIAGSVRDDFDFGSFILVRTSAIMQAAESMKKSGIAEGLKYAGFYQLRLKLAAKGEILHINEFLYSIPEVDTRKSGEKQFDYVNPRNREVQVEMEKVFTAYLKEVGAFLEPVTREVDFSGEFKVEASVIIPVRNRVNTIKDAILSALSQDTKFGFNVIVIDNHSTDGTSEILAEIAEKDSRLVHLVPQRDDLGIGGCWNMGVHSDFCGRFAIQLDSDDIYSDANTLQRIVDEFYLQKCAMMVGSYMLTDFQLNEIPPGLIDHREWTDDNGHNNALRINGLGAPRAFYTGILREFNLPNTSYGEDYAIGLRISREYKIGRIYDVLYFCRRWEGNSDAALDVVATNKNNLYKDKIRTWEIQARQALLK